MPRFEDGSYGSAKGIALIAKVLAGKCSMHYTRVAVGNGTIPEDMTPKTMGEPAGYIMDGMIASVTNPIDGECQVTVQVNSAQVERGFYATGLVLYASDPDEGEVPYTYLVLENEPEWIRPSSSIVGKLATFDIIAAVGDVDAVTVTIDPNSIVTADAVQQMIKEHNEDESAHPHLTARMRATEIALNGSETISGNGDPTAGTKGVIGQHYINSATGEEFVCTGVTEEGCIWEPLEAVKVVAQGLPLKAVTEEEYNALNEAEKAADVAYLVTDDAQDNPELPPPWNSQNQLDNSYWASKDAIINQMGQEEYQIRNYTIDRWILGWNPDYTPSGAKVTISDGYLEWEGKESWLIQRFPDLALTGKLLTLSVLLADGTLCSGSAVYDPTDAYAPYFKEQKMYAYAMDDETEGLWRVVLANTSEAPLQMVAAKLELGDRQTLARRDAEGNWVLNDPPPNKALELAKCQRYFNVLYVNAHLYPVTRTAGVYELSIQYPNMRANPSVSFIDSPDSVQAKFASVNGFIAVSQNAEDYVSGVKLDANL